MFLLKSAKYTKYLPKTIQQQCQLHLSKILNSNKLDANIFSPQFENQHLRKLFEKYKDKIIYNTFVDGVTLKKSYNQKGKITYKKLILKEKAKELEERCAEPLPVVLKYVVGEDVMIQKSKIETKNKDSSPINFPFANETAVSVFNNEQVQKSDNDEEEEADVTYKEVRQRHEIYKDMDFSKWMMDYENYEDYEDCEAEEKRREENWRINYGTPDPRSPISKIPCGGCGALLHCKDTAIPGYIPSEIYKNCFKKEGTHLKALICQRCYFLKNYDLALQVRVTCEDYPKILATIKNKTALIILMVDLLDFPCSIWPGILDTLGSHKPIVVVGNKVDLLPRDSSGYLDHIKKTLKQSVEKTVGENRIKTIKHVGLISAKTGWGVEELITKLHNLWSVKGDVYLVGCTNVGKSSLFNCLLQSDYCKVQAVDLVQRATTSLWPGTTLNLLKFPVLRPSGWRLYVRTKRLQSLRKMQVEEERLNKMQLKVTNDPKYATLMGHLERTFTPEALLANGEDPFTIKVNPRSVGKTRLGINENDPTYATGKWCYDTPGVVQPDQIIHLLTTEELMLTLPKQLLRPQTYSIRAGQTLFIGGIGRLDYLKGPFSIRLTVFRADSLPITICLTEDADLLYNELLGTDLFEVPKGSEERLKNWPHLKAVDTLKLTGLTKHKSCGDIVLSNAGWVAVTCDPECEVSFKAWTPEARGIYVRESILPHAVQLRGKKLRKSPAYTCDKFYIPK